MATKTNRKMNVPKISKLLSFLKTLKKVYIVIIVGVVLGVGLLILSSTGGEESIDKNKWQAVFLDNNQVYFGKLSLSSNFYILSNIFYLQTEQGGSEDDLSDVASDAIDIEDKKAAAKLVKLGGELHGPEDEMFIEKSKVLFWENLKDTSSVVISIEAYYQQN